MNTSRFIPAALVVVSAILAACGSGGGGSGGSHASGSDLGMSSVRGASVAASTSSAIHRGSPATFKVSVVASGVAPSQVVAGICAEYYDADSTGVTATATGGDRYDVTLDVPATLSGREHVWVRLMNPDGSVVETGVDDFIVHAD